MRKFVAAGAHVDDRDTRGRAPLHWAAMCAAGPVAGAACAEALLSAGASTEAHDMRGRTPLHAAAENGSAEVVAALLEVSARGLGEGFLLVKQALITIAFLFTAKQPCNFQTRTIRRSQRRHTLTHNNRWMDSVVGFYRIVFAEVKIFSSNPPSQQIAICLIQAGASPGADFDGGCTAVHLAAREGAEESLKYLLRAGGEADAPPDATGRSPLMYAVAGAHGGCAARLLKAGAGANLRYCATDVHAFKTPLHVATLLGLKEMVEKLLAANADVDVRDGDGRKALFYALQPACPRGDESKLVLESYSTSRLVAAGGRVESWMQRALLLFMTAVYYMDVASNAILCSIFKHGTREERDSEDLNSDQKWFLMCLASLLLPSVIATTKALVQQKPWAVVLRAATCTELGKQSWESWATGTMTPDFMTILFQCVALQSIPQAILQVHVLLERWDQWETGDIVADTASKFSSRVAPALLISISCSALNTVLTAACMTLENGVDSAWKERLEGSPRLGLLLAVTYYVGDGLLHTLAYSSFATTHGPWVFPAIGVYMMAVMALTFVAIVDKKKIKRSSTRALLLGPILTFVDFPLLPALHSKLPPYWLINRLTFLSAVSMWTLAAISLFKPAPSYEQYWLDANGIGEPLTRTLPLYNGAACLASINITLADVDLADLDVEIKEATAGLPPCHSLQPRLAAAILAASALKCLAMVALPYIPRPPALFGDSRDRDGSMAHTVYLNSSTFGIKGSSAYGSAVDSEVGISGADFAGPLPVAMKQRLTSGSVSQGKGNAVANPIAAEAL